MTSELGKIDVIAIHSSAFKQSSDVKPEMQIIKDFENTFSFEIVSRKNFAGFTT